MLLRNKLFAVILLTTLAALLFAIVAMGAYDLLSYHRSWVSDVTAQAQLVGRSSATALSFDDAHAAQENLAILRFQPKVRTAAIYNARGYLFARYPAGAADREFPTLPGTDGTSIEGNSVVTWERIVDGGEILGTVYLRADYELYERLLDYAGIGFVVLVASMLVALGLSVQLQRFVTRPILEIGRIAQSVVKERNFSLRARKSSDDEVGTLVESFNGMLGEIERRIAETENFTKALSREAEERRVAQQEVLRLNEGLEIRVRERTAQLVGSNEELAKAKEAADIANQAKSAFLSSMSHELRTPLNAVLGFGQLLESDPPTLTAEKRKDFTQQILKAGRHLLALINEILDLAQIESGKVSVSLEPVSLSETILECQVMLEPMVAQHGARVIYPTTSGLNVLADRTRLKQVLLNLVSNAIKYGGEREAVLVDCTLVARERIRISVRDSGAGLSPDQLTRLFQPFNRLGQEAGSKEGTGIGLVVTKRLVELMGGEIGVTSTVGVGSVFWIELRLAEAPQAIMDVQGTRVPNPVPVADGKEALPTILYVEDNPANLRLMEELIQLRGGFRLLTAGNAHLGLALARVHRPRIILLDLNLPDLDGEAVLEVLRRDARMAHIPVIAVTASAMPGEISRGLAKGFFRYVTKPVDLASLGNAIESAQEFIATRYS